MYGDLVFSGRRRTAHVASFFGLALGALDPYTDIAFPPSRHLRAFQRGLGRLLGLIELLADAQRVVSYKTDDGRRFMDLFKSAELG